jgi:hypothetical protein
MVNVQRPLLGIIAYFIVLVINMNSIRINYVNKDCSRLTNIINIFISDERKSLILIYFYNFFLLKII